jgi:hypothetical protein
MEAIQTRLIREYISGKAVYSVERGYSCVYIFVTVPWWSRVQKTFFISLGIAKTKIVNPMKRK